MIISLEFCCNDYYFVMILFAVMITLLHQYSLVPIAIYGCILITSHHTALCCSLLCTTTNSRGISVAAGCFVIDGALLMRDGPFIRPHPLFWRIVQAMSFLYLLLMIFFLFQPLQLARQIVGFTDASLGRPLEEKSYAVDCSLTWDNLKVRSVCREALMMRCYLTLFNCGH